MNSEDMTKHRIVIIVSVATVLLPLLFFGAILIFDLAGLPLYFAQLGLYAVFYLLAFWGMRSNGIRLQWNGKLVGCSLLVVLLSWLLYVLVMSVFGLVDLRQDARALASMPLWKIAAQIVSTWFFVGMAEEVLFRGFFLKKFLSWFEVRRSGHALLWAVITSSAFFSLWHLPVRLFSLVNGDLSPGLLLLSLAVLFALGAGFAWLYLRSGSVLLVWLVHGLMDYPLLGGNAQLGFIILLAAIGLVEVLHWMKKKAKLSGEEFTAAV